jgi:hypothetical protein
MKKVDKSTKPRKFYGGVLNLKTVDRFGTGGILGLVAMSYDAAQEEAFYMWFVPLSSYSSFILLYDRILSSEGYTMTQLSPCSVGSLLVWPYGEFAIST